MTTLKTWVRQPTTVAGFSALAGTLIAVSLGQMALTQAVPLLAGALVSIVLPDNTVAKQEAADLAKSVTALAAKAGGEA